ncbi:hypothetical protein FS837_005754 [Tulasnella sp. UAMH 9824]|nr:hypothetical protein FS837_005754 [Tulasnella sp. UAMH 9824]
MKQLIRAAKEAALSIPEVLSVIFSYASPETQAACAGVCKKWSPVALDELWRDLEDIYPLLKLLIRFEDFIDEYGHDVLYQDEMLELLRAADWRRFRQYATRVRSIEYDESAAHVSPPSREAIAFICLHHPYGNCLTPNLRMLRWKILGSSTVTRMLPFTSQRLEELVLDIELDSMQSADIFQGLAHRTLPLKRLSIISTDPPQDMSDSLTSWIETCTGLEKAHIPRRWQISNIVTAFGSLPNLLEFGIHWNRSPAEHMWFGKDMEIIEGHFQNLQRLGWYSDIKEATDLLQQASRGFKGLALDCPERPSRAEVVAFIATAAQRCPDLDSFCLNLTNFVDGTEPYEDTNSLRSRDLDDDTNPYEYPMLLDLGTFRPLLACKGLRELRIHSPGPCILSTLDLEEMGAAWPNMEELVLSPRPQDMVEEQGTPISMLPCVATAFPRIRLLGVYFDQSEPPDQAGDLLPEVQFRCLRELNVGSSRIPSDDAAAVGLYLASLFAVGTRPSIRVKTSVIHGHWGHDTSLSVEWEAVERLVHRAMRVKEAVLRRLLDR